MAVAVVVVCWDFTGKGSADEVLEATELVLEVPVRDSEVLEVMELALETTELVLDDWLLELALLLSGKLLVALVKATVLFSIDVVVSAVRLNFADVTMSMSESVKLPWTVPVPLTVLVTVLKSEEMP